MHNKTSAYVVVDAKGKRFVYSTNTDPVYLSKVKKDLPGVEITTDPKRIPAYVWNNPSEYGWEIKTIASVHRKRDRMVPPKEKEGDVSLDRTEAKPGSSYEEFRESLIGGKSCMKTAPIFCEGDSVFYPLTNKGLGEGVIAQIEESPYGDIVIIEKVDSYASPSAKIDDRGTHFRAFVGDVFSTIKEAEISIKKESQKIEKKSSYLTVADRRHAWTLGKGIDFYSDLTPQNLYQKAVNFTQDFLSNFSIQGMWKLKFNGVRNASYAKGNKVVKGDVTLNLEIRTISGVKVRADITVPIRKGKFVEPSVITSNNVSRVIAQTVFDDLISANSFEKRPKYLSGEQIVSNELLEKYLNMRVPIVQMGMFDRE